MEFLRLNNHFKVNYTTWNKTYKPPHAMYTRQVLDQDDVQKFLLVVDYYTPRHKRAGWWVALRKPGNVERQHPQHILFVSEDKNPPTLDTINDLLNTIFN
jgi:hypothetical protein